MSFRDNAAMSDACDVVIIGAGPAGLSLAGVLARQGWSVTVVDPAAREALAAPRDDGREIALTLLSRQLLEQWGQWSRLGEIEFAPLREAQVFDGDSESPMRVAAADGAEALGWMVSNHALRRVAYESAAEAAGIVWKLGRKAQDIATDDDGARVTLDDGEVIAARLVVAADSRFSASRRRMGIAARQHDFGRNMLVCRMRLEKPQPGIAWEWLGYGQTLALLPLRDDLASVVITLTPAEMDALQALSPEAFGDAVAARYGQRLGAMRLVSERHVYPLVGVAPERLVATRFACLGDAAIGMHPITAHGYNLGLRGIALLSDAMMLARRRGQDIADAEPLAEYERNLRAIALPLYLATLSVVHLYGDDRPGMRLLRRALLRIAEYAPPFQHLMRMALSGRDAKPPLPLRLLARAVAALPGRATH